MLIRKIAAGVCLSAALLFGASAQLSAKPLAGSALSGIPMTQAPADARVIQVDEFGFRLGDRDRRGRRDRHDGSRHRGDGPSFSLTIPVVPRREARNCGYYSEQCTDSWGYGNSDYDGCMAYYGC
jgi:hypothetical protein